MTITAPQLLSEIQTDLLEIANDGISWGTERWTTTEVYNHLRRRFQQFLKDTQAYTYLETKPTIPNLNRVDLADTWITGIRVAWRAFNFNVPIYHPPVPNNVWTFDPGEQLVNSLLTLFDISGSFDYNIDTFTGGPDFDLTLEQWAAEGDHHYTPDTVDTWGNDGFGNMFFHMTIAAQEYHLFITFDQESAGTFLFAVHETVPGGSEGNPDYHQGTIAGDCRATEGEDPAYYTYEESPQGIRTYTEIPRVDTWEVDHDDPASNYTMAHPKKYTEAELPPPQLNLWPAPDIPGQLELHSISMPTTFDPTTSTFAPLPDELVTYLKYGVMADMLSKQGRGLDMARAQYCESRYQEGVELVKMILTGGP